MKKLSDIKIYVTSYFKNLNRERIAIFICIPLSLIALSICAVMLISLDKETFETQNNITYVTEPPTEKYTYPSNSPYSIEFESLHNGTCAISGIGNFNEKNLKIPQKSPSGDTVVEINSNAFENCTTLESITIPNTVKKIGTEAFRGCSSLIYIDVDINNDDFTSIGGVLFSKDKSRLIYYPPKKIGEKYYLNPNVKTIDNYAFENATNISVILYPKSTTEFEAISIGKGNDVLCTLPITCNYVSNNNGK